MHNEQYDLFDVTIIGGGPSGLYSAFYSGLREMKTKIIDAQPELGGKLHVYPEKLIWDVGGQPPIPCANLIKQLSEQAMVFGPEVVLNTKIERIEKVEEQLFIVHTDKGEKHYSKTVFVAVGSGILKPQKLDIEGADRFEISNLHYTIKSFKPFKDKVVLISGGGNAALDWANELKGIAKQIILSYRNEQMKGHEAHVTQLMKSDVICHFNTTITRLIASADHSVIEKVELTATDSDEKTIVDVDDIVISHGYERDSSLIDNSSLNVSRKDDFYIVANSHCATDEPGLYAVGDISSYEGKLYLIAGTFQDAANAVNHAKSYIEPNANNYGMVSSHNDLFKERNREIVQNLVASK